MSFTDRLKEARLQKGLTQEQVALKIGVAKSTYTGYERGTREPNVNTIALLMDELGIDANYLYQDEIDSSGGSPYKLLYNETLLLKKYRSLDEHGKKIVDFIINEEADRCSHESTYTLSVEEQCAAAARDIRKYIGQIDVHDPDAGRKLEALIRGDHPESKQIG